MQNDRYKFSLKFFAVLGLVLGLFSLSACSATGGASRTDSPNGTVTAGGVDTPALTVAMISHGAPGDTFWDLVRKGAEDAAKKNNIELRYSSNPEAPEQANLVQNAIDSHVDGIALTLPNPDALGSSAERAVAAGIPTVALNAGMQRYTDFGISAFFGQDEQLAGQDTGKKLGEEGATHVLCVIHEQGNSSQEARCQGVADALPSGARSEIVYVNGMDLTSAQSTLQAKLSQDASIDWVLGLAAPVALRAVDAVHESRSGAKVATFDTNAQLVDAIDRGDVEFAVDQQPYLQGYLAVDAIWLAHRNGSVPGGGQAVLTGPSFVDKSNVGVIAESARQGLR